MGKIESVLKSEITRLSRRETKTMMSKTIAEVRQLRKRVMNIERELRAVKSAAAAADRGRMAPQTAVVSAPDDQSSGIRLSPGLLRALRRRLNISQVELAKLVGVSVVAVGLWETGRSRPRQESKNRIAALRKLGRRDVQNLLSEQKPEGESA
ncbi:MAG TPA: helix-turn-helix transcriptional regulator [Candidatus Brocadiia bacterium]|nr:helix-turn-helix transcriptional regulator [Candidatus Brocadiia bacterium]